MGRKVKGILPKGKGQSIISRDEMARRVASSSFTIEFVNFKITLQS